MNIRLENRQGGSHAGCALVAQLPGHRNLIVSLSVLLCE